MHLRYIALTNVAVRGRPTVVLGLVTTKRPGTLGSFVG
jgi:hypothetical protein